MVPSTIAGMSLNSSLNAFMNLIRDIGERMTIQEHHIWTAEKMAEGQEKLTTPSLSHLTFGQHRICNDRWASPHQDHQLHQPVSKMLRRAGKMPEGEKWPPTSSQNHATPRSARITLSKNGVGGLSKWLIFLKSAATTSALRCRAHFFPTSDSALPWRMSSLSHTGFMCRASALLHRVLTIAAAPLLSIAWCCT